MVAPTSRARAHFRETETLAKRLRARDIYGWLVTTGYFPEPYVLPPCFHVSTAPSYPKRYFSASRRRYPQLISQIEDVHFPKTDLTDRTFGIIHPEIHSDIAWNLARYWRQVTNHLFHPDNHVFSYSFPIPLNAKRPGKLSGLRAGRLIYEWIEMVEADLTHDAYRYKCMVRTDIRNFYPSIYTHAIPWALHTRQGIRQGNRNNLSLLGNRLDCLFQAANDGCTNGIPIGPAVSDLIAEILLATVDRGLSVKLRQLDILAVRFKDDYRFLCKSDAHGVEILKELQRQLATFSLLLGEDKTDTLPLPEGLFRPWRSRYAALHLDGKREISWRRFREVYGRVLEIDSDFPGTGVIDRFIADLYGEQKKLRVSITTKRIDLMLSLLLMLANRRLKSLPGVLGAIEALMEKATARGPIQRIEDGIGFALTEAMREPLDNRYKIAWLLYFLRSNRLTVPKAASVTGLHSALGKSDPICRTLATNRAVVFRGCKDFALFRGIRRAKRAGPLREHVDVFRRQ